MLTCSGVARSQMTPAHHMRFFFVSFFGRGGGGGVLGLGVCFLDIATKIVLETLFEMPLVLNRE